MSYTPIGWQTGDTITADKLNKMDNGWGVSSTQIFSETVITTDTGEGFAAGSLVYVFQSEPPQIAVITFDGVTYTCNRNNSDYGYGEAGASGPDFTNYPFYILPGEESTEIYTSTAGDYTVAVSAASVETSQNFAAAVGKATPNPLFHVIPGETTWQEVYDAVYAGKLAYVLDTGSYPMVMEFVSWIGESDRGDFVVATICYDGSAVGASRYSASSQDDVLTR